MRPAAIGVDVGGTKTAGALITSDGEVLARTQAGAGNYQEIGLEAATAVYTSVVASLAESAQSQGAEIAASAWGISGWDRPKDEAALLPALQAADGLPDASRVAVNDAFLLLRAGSPDGTGVAVVSGTGSNCVARGPDGVPRRVGGLAFEFGDGGSGSDIGRDGIRAAFRGADGRGRWTLLTELLIDRLNLDRLDDLVDHFIADAAVAMNESHAAPLVFDAATLGDPVATKILVDAGRELAHSARTLARGVYQRDDTFSLVLGGSVLQRASNPVMREALIGWVHDEFPNAVPETPTAPPLLGAALLGLDQLATLGLAAAPTSTVALRVATHLHEVS